jgi:hypothetical protein
MGHPSLPGQAILRSNVLRKIAVIILVAIGVSVLALAVWWSASPKPEKLRLTSDQWRDDLHYLVRELPKRHANAFHFTSREAFEKSAAEFDAKLPQLDADESWVGMQQLVSLVGDAHTFLQTPHDSAGFLLDIARFSEEYRVIDVDPAYASLLGARVVKVGHTSVEQAAERCKELFSRDENPPLTDGFVDDCLTTGGQLHGLKITSDRNSALYAVVDDSGKEYTAEVHAGLEGTRSLLRPFKEPPLYMKEPGQNFDCQYLPQAQTLYCNVRSIRDLKPGVREMMALIQQRHPAKLAIDLRWDRGGDYTEGEKYMIRPIRDLPGLNARGHLFVLIGANTFSAAMNNAAQFRQQTAAILVGQEIGEKPNSYQESSTMTLPNSHLTVHYSIRFYKFSDGPENAIRPDQEIVPTWADYKAGIDPVLNWVLAYK